MTEQPGKKPPAKKPAQPKKKKKKGFSAAKLFGWTFVAAVMAAVCAMGVYIFVIINGHKILKENIDKLDMDEASHVYDVNNNEVAVLYRENREVVTSAEIPERMKQAFIATEDKRFGEHAGVDFFGIGRALVKDVVARSMVEGGSTITQQLAKNVFLNADKTFFRKATEMSIAVALEQEFSKDEILEKYLNRIFFGQKAYGVKAASKKYFGVSDLKKLELWQIATLAAMPKAPSTYNPIANPEKSKERRAVVLKLMYDQGYITEAEKNEAAAVDYTPLPSTDKKDYQAFLDYVVDEAQERYGIEEDALLRSGYKIYTTMDANAQKIMEQTFAQDKFFQKPGPEQKMQGSMVIVNNKDGGIVAMVGGRDYVPRGLNRAADPRAARQPGSSFKPLVVFAPALESGKFTPYSRLKDEEMSYGNYSPRNYDGVYKGEVDMFDAIKRSVNSAAVWTLNEIGPMTGVNFVKKMGIELDPQKDRNLAIALGGLTRGVTPLQMAQAYSAFPNNGFMNTAFSILKIEDDQGSVVASAKPERKSVMSSKTAWYMTQMMEGVVNGGTGSAAKFERPVAGKTGTTQLDLKGLEKFNRDLWFAGYTPEWTAAVWLGFDKTDTKHYVSMSSAGPAVIFKEVMQKALAKRPATKFTKPDGVEELGAPPKTIGDLKAEYNQEKKTMVLSWSSVGDKVVYQLFRKEAQEKEFPAEPFMTSASTTINDMTPTKPGATYHFVVVPLNQESNVAGAKSNIAEVQIPADAGATPQVPGQPGQPGQGNPNGGTQPGGANGGTGTGTGGTGPGGNTTRPGTEPGTGTGTAPGTGTTPAPGTGTGGTGGTGGTQPPATTQPSTGTGTTAPTTGTAPGTGAPKPTPTTQPGGTTTTQKEPVTLPVAGTR